MVFEYINQNILFFYLFYNNQYAFHKGYEVVGVENIPKGGALLVYYHGALPIDFYHFTNYMMRLRGRKVHIVGDRFLLKVPGSIIYILLSLIYHSSRIFIYPIIIGSWSNLIEAYGIILDSTVERCAAVLKQDDLLAIAPGGVFEAQFGDDSYELLWKQRRGFAKVAIEARVVRYIYLFSKLYIF